MCRGTPAAARVAYAASVSLRREAAPPVARIGSWICARREKEADELHLLLVIEHFGGMLPPHIFAVLNTADCVYISGFGWHSSLSLTRG